MINLTLKQSGTVIEKVGAVYFVDAKGHKVFIKIGDFLAKGLVLYSEQSNDFSDVHLVLDSIKLPLYFTDDNPPPELSTNDNAGKNDIVKSIISERDEPTAHSNQGVRLAWGLGNKNEASGDNDNDDDNLDSLFDDLDDTGADEQSNDDENDQIISEGQDDVTGEDEGAVVEPPEDVVVNQGVILTPKLFTLDEDSAQTPFAIELPADPDGDTLTITIDSLPLVLGVVKLADGTIVKVGDNLTAAQFNGLTFSANANANGEGRLGYSVSDGTNNQSSYININLTSLADTPQVATYTIAIDENSGSTPLAIPVPTDADGDSLTITMTDIPTSLGQYCLMTAPWSMLVMS